MQLWSFLKALVANKCVDSPLHFFEDIIACVAFIMGMGPHFGT